MTNQTNSVDTTATEANVDNVVAKTIESPTIVLDRRTMGQYGITMSKLIEISELGYYGFNRDIIRDMVEYQIFPQVYKVKTKFYVQRSVIFGNVEKLLANSMVLYKAVDGAEKAKEELAARAVPVSLINEVTAEAQELGIDDVEVVQEMLDSKVASLASPADEASLGEQAANEIGLAN